jgi:selT/selW/selH-like putative selenoprotein
LAAEIENTLGIEAELVEGTDGVFDVVANGELIFSKHSAGRFPEHPEILVLLGA